jgi:hypothetical protein
MDKVTHYAYCDFPGYSKCGKNILWLFFLWLFLLLVLWLFILWLFFRLPFMYCIYNISFIGRDVRKSNIDFIEISCSPMKNYYLHQWFVVVKSVNGQKVTGQKVTKPIGQKVTGQKSQSIFFTLADKKSQLIFLLNMYVGRTRSHNIYIPWFMYRM